MNQSITRFGSFFGKVMAGVVPIAFQSQLIRIASGCPPVPVTVTTRRLSFFVGDP